MKKMLYTILFMFLGITNIYADETFTYEAFTNYTQVKALCANNSFNIYFDGQTLPVVYRINSNNIQIKADTIDSSVTIDSREYKQVYYVDYNGKRLYIEPSLVNAFNTGNCLPMAIDTTMSKYPNLNVSEIRHLGVLYARAFNDEKTTLVQEYKIDCTKYSKTFNYVFPDFDTRIKLYKNLDGYFLAIDNATPVLNPSSYGIYERWCRFDDNECLKKYTSTAVSSPQICGYSLDVTTLRENLYVLFENPQQMIGKKLYLLKIGDYGGFYVDLPSNESQYKIIDTIDIYTEDIEIENDKETVTCTYDFYGRFGQNEIYNIHYNPNRDQFLISSTGVKSEDPVRGLLAENMKKGVCQTDIYFCRDRHNGNAEFFVDYVEYQESYKDTEKYTCIGTNMSEDQTDKDSIGIATDISYYYAKIKNPLQVVSSEALHYEISINGKSTTLDSVKADDSICSISECYNDPKHYLSESMKGIVRYCSVVYKDNSDESQTRLLDCMQFKNFYKKLVGEGILDDLTSGCGFVSNELAEKLIWILDLLKIVGPIAALGLGTLDFIKAFASGDADKELKTAFKRFSIRIIAAVLLFIIPFILAFLMDTFLGNEEGYNPDNPFCNIVEWE